MKELLKNILGAIIAVLILFSICHSAFGWSTPAEKQDAIDDALDEYRDEGLLFESRLELELYTDTRYGEGFEKGYEQGCSDGYTQGDHAGYAQGWEDGYRDGYADGYSDCEDGVPYVER